MGSCSATVIGAMADPFRELDVTHVLGIEARGFILGGAVATNLGVGFVPARKPGKLPWERVRESYELEYGTDALECHRDGMDQPGEGPGSRRRPGDRGHRACGRPARARSGRARRGVELPSRDRRARRQGATRRRRLPYRRKAIGGVPLSGDAGVVRHALRRCGEGKLGCSRDLPQHLRPCHFSLLDTLRQGPERPRALTGGEYDAPVAQMDRAAVS